MLAETLHWLKNKRCFKVCNFIWHLQEKSKIFFMKPAIAAISSINKNFAGQ